MRINIELKKKKKNKNRKEKHLFASALVSTYKHCDHKIQTKQMEEQPNQPQKKRRRPNVRILMSPPSPSSVPSDLAINEERMEQTRNSSPSQRLLSLKQLCMLSFVNHPQGVMMLQEEGPASSLLKRLLPLELHHELQEFLGTKKEITEEKGWSMTLTIERKMTKKVLLSGDSSSEKEYTLMDGAEIYQIKQQHNKSGQIFLQTLLEVMKDPCVEKKLKIEELPGPLEKGKRFCLCRFRKPEIITCNKY
jgi:hypothetical protein